MIRVIFAFFVIAFSAFAQIIGSDFIKIDKDSLSITDESKFAAYIKNLDNPDISAKYREIMAPIDILGAKEDTAAVFSYEEAFKALRTIYSKLYLKEKPENIDKIASDIKLKQSLIVSTLLSAQGKNLYDTDIIPIIFEYRKLDRELLRLSVQKESLLRTKNALVDTIVKKKLRFENDDANLSGKIKAANSELDGLKTDSKRAKNDVSSERILIKSAIVSMRLKSYEIKEDFFEKIRLVKNIKSQKESQADKDKLETLLGKSYEPLAFDAKQVNSSNKDLFAEYQKEKELFMTLVNETKLDSQVFEAVFKSFDESLPTRTSGIFEVLVDDVKAVLNFPLFVVNNSDIKVQTVFGVLIVVALIYLLKGWLNLKFIPAHFEGSYKDAGHSEHIKFIVSKLITITAYFCIVFVILSGFGLSLTNFAIIVSALSVGIGFGLQGVISNFVSGVILLFENSIKIGDILSLPSGQTGIVTSVNLRTTNIKTGDDVTILIPNSNIFTGQIENLTKDGSLIRRRVKFSVGYGTDVAKLKAILDEKAAVMMPDVVLSSQLGINGYGNYGIDVEYRVFVDLKKHPLESGDFLKEFLEVIDKNGIELPYPKLEIVKFAGKLQ
ncbi:MAG: mechanosensitive ion channel [Campylobacterales bacterium]|nr:mechanosensitive ion channel [Campylobacterales bacterium]